MEDNILRRYRIASSNIAIIIYNIIYSWEQRKLGAISDKVTKKNQDIAVEEVFTNSAEFGIISQRDFFDKDIANAENIDGYYVVEPDDFVYNPRISTTAPFGPIKRNKLERTGAMSPLYYVFRPHDIDLSYLEWFFQTTCWHAFMRFNGNSGARSDRFAITDKIFNEMPISIPQDIEEQKKLGTFLTELDNLITLHQRKCDETKSLKKYMLQKMFPKNGEQFPEIRFSGFTDAWEQRKFSDFTWNAGKRNSQNLDLEPYAVTNDRGFIRQNEAHDEFGYMKDVDRKAYNIVMPNSFAYNPARINVGSIGYYEGTENVIVSSLYEVFQTADYVDDRFLWHWFKSDIFPKWIERLQEGSVRLYFYYDKLCECKMLMPSLPEQRKIAATLDEIDNLITLHQRERIYIELEVHYVRSSKKYRFIC